MTNLNNLKCIKLTHVTDLNETLVSYISFEQFTNSFVKERWEGERRSNKTYTMFGYVHTKTTVKNPYNGNKSIRTFEFPHTREEAQQIHSEQA